MEKLEAPFSQPIAHALNQSQVGVGKGMVIHPFTCVNRGDGQHGEEGGDTGVLIATLQGWVCPHCDYTQHWAHPVMASSTPPGLPDWLQKHRDDQVPEILINRLKAYRMLQARRPGAAGVGEMIDALEARRQQIDQSA
ncbi:hypothetical protein [Pseudomonas amygdali]|uniref:Uncharacterized protein n=1 Tax=Pseudomonas amygdali pv. lachrymans str. M301315 TaxID=629260 RepID=A0AAD0PWD3_PSEAV|nr:hypothetical protein [Pseudomonas amygdali]AXH59970.1 hypothetical protein PLA107_032610 [Pseudomonas amygdali pv. lachrymans str. M301315]